MPKYNLPRKQALGTVGTSGLEHSGGEVTIDPLKSLHGEKGIKLYHEMATNSSVIGSVRFLIRNWITQADWIVKPVDATPKALETAEFLESCMYDMSHSWEDFIGDALTMIDFGWAYCEVIYKMRRGDSGTDPRTHSRYTDGKIGWQRIPLRGHLSWWSWEIRNDRLVGMVQNDTDNGNGNVLIPIEKAVHFRTENTYGNPEGRSLYRNAVLDWYALKRVSEYELIGIERDLTGMPVMRVPLEVLEDGSDANTTVLPYLETIMAQIKRDERGYAILPPKVDENGQPTGYEFELMASPGKHQIDTTAVRSQYRANILQSVLAQFLEFGVAQHGSFSLSDSATNNFAMALGGLMDNITSTINKQAVEPLMRMNQIPQELWPELCHGDLETPSLDKIAQYVSSLSGAGIDFTDPETVKQLRRYADLPDDVDETHNHGEEY